MGNKVGMKRILIILLSLPVIAQASALLNRDMMYNYTSIACMLFILFNLNRGFKYLGRKIQEREDKQHRQGAAD